MLNMTVHGRLGRDTELRYLDDGRCVADMAIGCNYGRKVEGKQPTQWVKATLWGKQAEGLAEYLTKGVGVVVVLSDVNVKTYEKRGDSGGMGVSLEGFVQSVEFTGAGPRNGEAPAPKPAPAPPPRQAEPAKTPSGGFDDMDDDIPF